MVCADVSISPQRIVSLWLKRLSTDRVRRHLPNTAGRAGEVPLIVVTTRGNVEELAAVDAAAERFGLRPGMALAEARAMYPEVAVVAEDRARDQKLLEDMADWCQLYTPLTAVEAPAGILLDITGCAHLFGGEQRLVDDLAQRMMGFGFTGRIAVAATIGAACAAARFSATTIIKTGAERDFLAPLPVAALRLPTGMLTALTRVGLKRIGEIIDLPRAPLAARFGATLLRQLDRALGHAPEPLNLRLPVAPYVAEQRFAEPIAREEDVLAVTERLAARLKTLLERRGEGARCVELALFRTDGVVRRMTVSTSRPVREACEIRALFSERLAALADAFDPGFGFDLARLGVLVGEPSPPEQINFDHNEDSGDLDRLVDRLSARLGTDRVARLLAPDRHLPEFAAIRVPAQMGLGKDPGWKAFREFRSVVDLCPRPPRLLSKPEPIEAIADVPDGPPVRFRWRRALHEVIAADGPERMECDWWNEEGPARDYFRVEDSCGGRFWLFRSGLYRAMAAPSWFMHGLFA
jgi:protein ImuB